MLRVPAFRRLVADHGAAFTMATGTATYRKADRVLPRGFTLLSTAGDRESGAEIPGELTCRWHEDTEDFVTIGGQRFRCGTLHMRWSS